MAARRSCQFFLICLIASMAIFLFLPRIVLAGLSITITSFPAQVQIGEEFTISVSMASLEPGVSYYIKSRIGKTSSAMNQGETFNSSTSSWLGDSANWIDFPTILADSEGSSSASLKSRAKQSADPGENFLVIRLRKVGAVSNAGDSDSVVFTLSASPTPFLSPTPTPTLTPSAATYKINEVKDEDGNALSSVKIYVDGEYVHHYTPETLTFCDGCQCNVYANCGFGEHTIRLEKSGYGDWNETKTINTGDHHEVSPIMKASSSDSPTSTPTPRTTPTSKLSPTPKPTKTKKATVSGEVLGEESTPAAFYPWEATEEAETVSEAGSSDKNRWLPKVFLGLGFVLLFAAAFYIWYTQLRR